MKLKQTLILFAVVAAVIAAIAIYELAILPGRADKQEAESLLFPGLDIGLATRIEIQRGDTLEVMLRGGDSVWSVETRGGFKADPDAIKNALQTISELKLGNPAATSKQNHERLGVDASGLIVKLGDGASTLAGLVVGKPGANYGTTFVRKLDSDATYLVYEDLKNIFDRAWRDRRIFDLQVEDLAELKLYSRPEQEEGAKTGADYQVLILKKDNGTGEWSTPGSGDSVDKLDKNKVESLARNLCTLRASDFADGVTDEAAGLTDPAQKAELTLQSGETYTLLIGNKDDSRYFVKRTDYGLVEKVYQYNIQNAFKNREDLTPQTGQDAIQDFDMGSLLPAPPLEVPGLPGQE